MSSFRYITAGIAVIFGSFGLNATTNSSPSEYQGYQNCIEDMQQDYWKQGLVHSKHYFLERTDDERIYYVNSTAWNKGERVHLRTECKTSQSGGRLVSRDTDYGRFSNQRTVIYIDVAGTTREAPRD